MNLAVVGLALDFLAVTGLALMDTQRAPRRDVERPEGASPAIWQDFRLAAAGVHQEIGDELAQGLKRGSQPRICEAGGAAGAVKV